MSIYVSASGLRDYLSCQTKLYYRIFETGVALPSKEALIGTLTHKIIEKCWDDKEQAYDLLDKLSKQNDLDSLSNGYMKNYIEIYFSEFRKLLAPNDLVEHKFKVKLFDDVYIVGVMDRISSGAVFDWKTGSSIPKKLGTDPQFLIYSLAYKLLFHRPATGLYLASVRTGELLRYSESKLHMNELVSHVIPEYVRSIREKTFVKNGLFNGACYKCQFKSACLDGDKDVVDSGKFVEA